MSDYTHRGTCSVPIAMQSLANAIWLALDPDTGGDKSFDTLSAVDSANAEYAITSALCTAEFANNGPYLLANPQALYHVVSTDYANRWSELQHPSVDMIAQFCEEAKITVTTANVELYEHLNSLGLKLK